MLSRAALYAFVAFFAVNTTSIADDKTEVPTWKKASPGTSAFLGDDGGGVNTLTVCDTADHFRDWLEYEHPAGCQTFQAGLRATIEVVVFDPVRDALRTSSEIISKPLVKIHIPARKFIGYVQLLGLHPIVPPGTIIYGKPSHNEDTIHIQAVSYSDGDG